MAAEMAIGAGVGMVGAVMAAREREQAARQAKDLINASVEELTAIGYPPEEAMKVSLEKARSAGTLTPELESEITQGRTEMEGIQSDPRLKEAQMNALLEMQGIGSGETRLSDKVASEKILGEAAQQEKGSREAIEQDMRQRGAYGSGAELAMKLQNQQGSAGRAANESLGVAQGAQDRALQALMQSGQLGGSIRGQDFGEQERIKSAQDQINQMNTMARQNVQQRNIASRNNAQQYNLGNAQNIMNTNTGLANQQEIANKGLVQQNWQNKMNVASAKANQRAGQASNITNAGNAAAAGYAGTGAGLSQIAIGYGQQQNENEQAGLKRQNDLEIAKQKKGLA